MKNFVVANFKMKQNLADAKLWVSDFTENVSDELNNTQVILCPSYVHFGIFSQLKHVNVTTGSQDVSIYEVGSHTGDVGAFQIKDFSQYCIVGHSERAEDQSTILKKIDMCLENSLIPIVCFVNINDVSVFAREGVVLAWEDPNSISVNGQYRAKNANEIQTAVMEIRNKISANTALLYGGSVNKDNINDITKLTGLNGVLVGHASLDPLHFIELIKAYEIR